MLSEPTIFESASDDPTPLHAAHRPGRSVDAELVLAAIDRMEAALRSERVTLDRLHAELVAMAQAIAQAKIAVQSGAVKPGAADGSAGLDVAALLDQLQQRVDMVLEIGARLRRHRSPADDQDGTGLPNRDARTEIVETPPAADEPPAGAAAVATPPPEPPTPPLPPGPDQVPTVTGVVSRLGRAGEEPAEDPGSSEDDIGRSGAPSVAALEAMVLALSALDATGDTEATPFANGFTPAPEAARAAPTPGKPAPPANEPLAIFTRMESLPIPPQETGEAVVFAPRPPEPVPETPAKTSTVAEPAPGGAAAPAVRRDPLARLNAMSAEEKIALFS
jgi:hypothetical protein